MVILLRCRLLLIFICESIGEPSQVRTQMEDNDESWLDAIKLEAAAGPPSHHQAMCAPRSQVALSVKVPYFVRKCYEIVEDPSTNHCIKVACS